MQRSVWGAAIIGALLGLASFAGQAEAQVPPPSPEASEIATCLCMEQQMGVLRSESTQRQASYDSLRNELGQMDADLARQRSSMDVNNPEAVARFRALLERRDALYRRSVGQVAGDATAAAGRYNRKVDEYNARCANVPRNPELLARVQSTLSCPPMY